MVFRCTGAYILCGATQCLDNSDCMSYLGRHKIWMGEVACVSSQARCGGSSSVLALI
jgi:hypothetical protein